MDAGAVTENLPMAVRNGNFSVTFDSDHAELGKTFVRNSIPAAQRIKFVQFIQTPAQVAALAPSSDQFPTKLRRMLDGIDPALPAEDTPEGIALDARWGAVEDGDCSDGLVGVRCI